ncbi:hypothetical protein Y032_1402g3865, partial [Ancylostoma ceylanicum]
SKLSFEEIIQLWRKPTLFLAPINQGDSIGIFVPR